MKQFDVETLSDVVVLAGPNGVGKTRLLRGLIQFFQSPRNNPGIRLIVDATAPSEQRAWGKTRLDTAEQADAQLLLQMLSRNRRRTNLESSVLQFDSDRSIERVAPYQFTWDVIDPWVEEIGWGVALGRLRDRFQDTMHSLFRKSQRASYDIAKRAEELRKRGERVMSLEEFPDPLEPFKAAFSQLLAPKELVDIDLKTQQLRYTFENQTFPITELSSGEREVVNIVFDFLLRSPSDNVVFFDEPELHLHPELSYKLLQTLRTIGARNQFVFCTHSPDIITASLDNTVVFIAPPKTPPTNQAVLVREHDETHEALKLLGHSIGIVSLGKKIVLIEGGDASLDKQVYGELLRTRTPNLVLVPSGGKGIIRSFAAVKREVLDQTIWGVRFFMLCDRDAVPSTRPAEEVERDADGHLRVLKRYHLENYFLDEEILASIFEPMEPEGSNLRSPTYIESRLKDIARSMLSYAAALIVAAEHRERVGDVNLMPSGCHNKGTEELVALVIARARSEQARVLGALSETAIEESVRRAMESLSRSLDEPGGTWKALIPGKPIIKAFAAETGLGWGRLKQMYVKAAESREPSPFQEIIEIFEGFSAK